MAHTLTPGGAPPTPLEMLRFLSLSVAVHADALCCAVDDVEAALIESFTNDELLDALEGELAVLLDRQRRIHAAQSVITLSQEERRLNALLRHRQPPLPPMFGEKRIQTSRALSSQNVRSYMGCRGCEKAAAGDATSQTADDCSTCDANSVSSPAPACEFSEGLTIDQQVQALKAKIEYLDRYSVRGKLLQIEKQKRAVKEVNLDAIVSSILEKMHFPAAVQSLWSGAPSPKLQSSNRFSSSPSASSSAATSAVQRGNHLSLAQYAVGAGGIVNHKNVDVLLARACQRFTGRAVDALDALASTQVSEESAAAHVLGCVVYAGEFDSAEASDIPTVRELQSMPERGLSALYAASVGSSVREVKIDPRCYGECQTVLAAQDFIILPAEWAATQTLSQIPLAEVLPPVRHLLAPRFTFSDTREMKQLQAKRLALQEKVVHALVGGPDVNTAMVNGDGYAERDLAVAEARLAVADVTPPPVSPYSWKTLLGSSE